MSDRLAVFAKATEISLDRLEAVDNAATATSDIRAGDKVLVTIADVDAVVSGQSRNDLANRHLQAIRKSVAEFRASYSAESLVKGTIYALISTVALVISFLGIARSIPILHRQFRQWQGTRIRAFRLLGTRLYG